MYANAFFFHSMNRIGGVETMFYELAKKYGRYDITIFYRNADPAQLARLKNYVRCIRFDGQDIECRRAFFNYDHSIFAEHVHAEETFQIIHANYKLQKLKVNTDPFITHYIAVSEANAEVFREYTGLECDVCANPLTLEPVQPPLWICAAQRMTAEKGFSRIKALVEALDSSDVKYYMTIFSDIQPALNSPNVAYMQPRLDIRPFIAGCDLFVAVSDSEGRCYSVGEKLGYGSGKLLITPIPSFFEQGCNEKNSIILEYDCSNMSEVVEEIRKMYKARKLKKTFAAAKCEDDWDRYLIHEPSTYTVLKVRATDEWQRQGLHDAQLGYMPKPGEEWVVDEDRLAHLLAWDGERPLVEKVDA